MAQVALLQELQRVLEAQANQECVILHFEYLHVCCLDLVDTILFEAAVYLVVQFFEEQLF